MSTTERFTIYNRHTGAAQFACDLETVAGETSDKKLGRAVVKAVQARANLYGANLARANLARANLVGANLDGAYLVGAYLVGANLDGAYLVGADLVGANLARANLYGANLARANLARANLVGANLDGAIGAELVLARTRILPQGSIIGWKKCENNIIVKLRIPEEARRSHAWGRKCRAEYADVLAIDGADEAISMNDRETRYVVGQRVECDEWNDNWKEECAGGIHFYITREEAEAHS